MRGQRRASALPIGLLLACLLLLHLLPLGVRAAGRNEYLDAWEIRDEEECTRGCIETRETHFNNENEDMYYPSVNGPKVMYDPHRCNCEVADYWGDRRCPCPDCVPPRRDMKCWERSMYIDALNACEGKCNGYTYYGQSCEGDPLYKGISYEVIKTEELKCVQMGCEEGMCNGCVFRVGYGLMMCEFKPQSADAATAAVQGVFRRRLLAEADGDGDGVLNATEAAAAVEAEMKHEEEHVPTYPEDHPHAGSPVDFDPHMGEHGKYPHGHPVAWVMVGGCVLAVLLFIAIPSKPRAVDPAREFGPYVRLLHKHGRARRALRTGLIGAGMRGTYEPPEPVGYD